MDEVKGHIEDEEEFQIPTKNDEAQIQTTTKNITLKNAEQPNQQSSVINFLAETFMLAQ